MSIYARLIAIAAIAFALAAGAWKCYTAGQNNVRAAWTAEKLATSESARLRERAAQVSNERIDHAYQKQKAADRAAAAAAADSLRDFQALIKPNSPASAASGTNGTGGLDRELLGHCAEALASLGQAADRLESKVVGLQGYVTGVGLAK